MSAGSIALEMDKGYIESSGSGKSYIQYREGLLDSSYTA
jgi:hypothetical protein